jgi:dipeptidase E
MKLFLYSSFKISPKYSKELIRLVGKAPKDITVAAIVNAADVEADSTDWVQESVDSLGFGTQVIDLRSYRASRGELRETLANKDVIWLCGGNQYYLRWILRQSGADAIIKDLVRVGKVYAGWSAGAVVAGPTLKHMEHLEDLSVVPEVLFDGLGLTDVVVLPHFDMAQFAGGMQKANEGLKKAGFITVPLLESQALIINGEAREVI